MKAPPAKTIFVVLLAVGAVTMVASTLFGGKSRSRRSAAPAPAAAAAAASTATRAPATSPAAGHTAANSAGPSGPRVVPREPIDVTSVLAALPRWTESPSHDPFSIYEAPRVVERTLHAADVLSLKAILRQTGGRLAVINNHVVAEGERIGGFRIEVIEPNQVQVRGSNGVERIDFSTARSRPAATNTLVKSAGPAGPGPTRDRTLSP